MKKTIFLLVLIFASCNFEKPTNFSELALEEMIFSLDDTSHSFKEVLEKYKGKKVVINVWASWCGDCLRGLPSLKNLQKQYPDVVFLFLSVDKSKRAWKKRIKISNINGEHFNLPKGMKEGDLVDFLNLGWIPRYLVIDEQGNIKLFKATSASDSSIVEALK